MLGFLKKLMKIENAPTLVAFFVSFGVVILDLAKLVSTETVLTALLLSIGVLAIGTLVERATYLDRIEDRIIQLSKPAKLGGIARVYERRDQLPEYGSYIASAKTEILITGLSLGITVLRFFDPLKTKAKSGCSIKLLLIAPPKDEADMAALRSLGQMTGRSEGILSNDIENSLNHLADILASVEPETRKRIEVRTYRFIPTLGVLSVDGGSPTGKILLSLYPYRASEVNWPALELKHQVDEQSLFEFFYEHTKQMWLDATPWSIPLPKPRHQS